MQTPKARSGTSEAPPRVSPRTATTAARKLRPTPLDTDSTSSSAKTPPSTRSTPKDRSPKTIERKSPRSPVPEKRRPSKLSELETQIARLREELEQAKEQLRRSESEKKQVELDREESKKHAEVLSEKLGESEKQAEILSEKLEESREHLREVSGGEESRLAELSRISDERDEARRCELETVTRQHSVDSVALAAALDEARWLKVQLETAATSEAKEASRARAVVEEMKTRIRECEESEAEARSLARETLAQLEAAKSAVESLRARVGFLEGLVGPAQPDLGSAMEAEISSMVEAEELRGKLAEALAEAEIKVEEMRARTQLEARAEAEELRGRLMDRETEAQGIAEENEALKAELRAAGRERKEEAERSREKAEAARAEISAVEAEMRRVRVQSDQWRKAAEAAAAMLSGGGGKIMERTGSLDSSYYSPGPAPKFGSIFGDDTAVAAEEEDDLLKKKNGNVLKKIGVLWKKPQK